MRSLAKCDRTYGAIDIVDRPSPTPEDNEVLIKVEYAGLCGSDAGIYEFESAFERMTIPTVIGHEYSGRVIEVGEEVMKFDVGDHVVERPIRGCGDCYQCEIGEENVCQDAMITGVDHDGAYAGLIAVPEDAVHLVPDSVKPQHAAMVEPISIGARAVGYNSRVGAGDRVLVAGPGPIGLFTAQIAEIQGGEVLVAGVDRDTDYRLPLVESLGFETINVEASDRERRREALTNGVGYDVVLDTTGHPSGLEMAVEEVRKGGQIVLVGQTGETTMPYSPLVRAEIDLQCSYASTYVDFDRSLRLIESGDVNCATMLDDRFSLLAADEAFEAFLSGETCKPVFDVSELRE